MVEFRAKIVNAHSSEDNQQNKEWWNSNPMLYDWEGKFNNGASQEAYYQSIDNVFGEGHSLVNNPRWPEGYILENFIPYHQLQKKSVLEIGCGAGLVASHLAKAGASLTAIDLTPKAIDLTRARFQLQGLNADILQMDAETMAFNDASFDYVVSWGVIHHSGNMQDILDEIYRVLKPGSKAFIMVYNKNSLRYQVYCRLWLGIFRAKLLKLNTAEIVGSITDGYIARHLTEPEFQEMAKEFSVVKFSYSDEKDTTANYLLGPFRRVFLLAPKIKNAFERFLARKWGWYMQVELTK